MFEPYRVLPGKIQAIQVTINNFAEVAMEMNNLGAKAICVRYPMLGIAMPVLIQFHNEIHHNLPTIGSYIVRATDWVIRFPDGVFAVIPDVDFWQNYERDI